MAAAEAELSFSRSNTAGERLASLARLVELGRGDMVGKLWSGLPTQAEQLAVFNVEDERLVGVIREIYVSLADVSRTGYADPLLEAMKQGLAHLPSPSAEADTLQAELEQWLQARQQAREELDDQAALDKYDRLMALNEHNPAVLYERARVLAGLGRYEEALDDLDRVLELLNDNPSLVVTGQMPQAIGRLIYWVEPELGELFDHSGANTPHLVEASARLTETREVKRVLVEAGPFEMGSENGDENEKPIHTVTLEDFNIDQYEVTNAQYAACVDADVCDSPLSASSASREGYYGNPEYADYPVINVNWDQAGAYCKWRMGQLPTEAQWEKAARGTDGRTYPWGEEIDCNRANIYGCG
ncbi:MAG: SUMF1/EgtB/PvdO family nonheme iron enzyme [Chloroflexi bacterium]|nr:SUMF1/EgtB/PvdO family nonheme iron enzyme [Chloroflexota bacterium]